MDDQTEGSTPLAHPNSPFVQLVGHRPLESIIVVRVHDGESITERSTYRLADRKSTRP